MIKDILEIAKQRKGKIRNLSDYLLAEKVDWNIKVGVKCKKGHFWKATPAKLKSGSWCPKCAGVERGTIEGVEEIVEERGGKLHSTKYTNIHTKVKVECKNGHVWKVTPNNLKKGSWCPYCNLGRNERLCRIIFKAIFGKKFPKIRPDWLINDQGNRMELDGYDQELKLAFEYQGRQHYEYIPYFYETIEQLEQSKKNDQIKYNLCEKNGINLIIVPYAIEPEELVDYIIDQCRKKDIKIPKNSNQINSKHLINKSYLDGREWEKVFELQNRIDKYIFSEVE